MDWEIAGDTGALPWIGKKSGRAAVIDFVNDSRSMVERISFDVHDILAGNNRVVILGSLASKLKRTGKIPYGQKIHLPEILIPGVFANLLR